jgi:hypothetical protein
MNFNKLYIFTTYNNLIEISKKQKLLGQNKMYLKIITWDGKTGHIDLLDTCKPQIMLSDVASVRYYDEDYGKENQKCIEVMYKDKTYEYFNLFNYAYLMNEDGKTINVYSPRNGNCIVEGVETIVV